MPRYLRKTRASPVTYSDLVHFAFYESQKSKNFGPNPISVRFLNMKVETYAKETGKALRGKYWARYCEPIIEAGIEDGIFRRTDMGDAIMVQRQGRWRYSNTKAHADNPDIEDLRERLRLVCQHLRTTMAPTRKKTKFQLLKENNELRNQLWGARSPPPSVWSDASSSDNGEVKMDVCTRTPRHVRTLDVYPSPISLPRRRHPQSVVMPAPYPLPEFIQGSSSERISLRTVDQPNTTAEISHVLEPSGSDNNTASGMPTPESSPLTIPARLENNSNRGEALQVAHDNIFVMQAENENMELEMANDKQTITELTAKNAAIEDRYAAENQKLKRCITKVTTERDQERQKRQVLERKNIKIGELLQQMNAVYTPME